MNTRRKARCDRHSRREFFARVLNVTVGATLLTPALGRGQPPGETKMKICLTPGSIGVSANQMEAIALAERHGFEAVEPIGGFLGSLPGQKGSGKVAPPKGKTTGLG